MLHHVRNFRGRSLKLLLGVVAFAAFGTVQAQPPTYSPSGYDFLGRCGGHEYYISTAYVTGLEIATTVTDFRTKTSLGPNDAYAAAIVNEAENDCVTDLMLAYNQAKYGIVAPPVTSPHYSILAPGDKSTYPNWGDARNPWIGLSDAQIEGTFVWSNGQPDCEDFRNWNLGEPNNYVGNVSNGEDFTQMLIMNKYQFDANTPDHDPLGKWNDWFNTDIIDPSGANLGITRLPLIIEVGPADCGEDRGNYGCSHGYWKNAKDKAWNEVGGLSRLAKFSNVFGIINGRGVITLGVTTMQDALELKGGGYAQVAKQAVAALMNANAGYFPYTSSEIIAAVQAMFNDGNASLASITVNGVTYTGGNWNNPTGLASYLAYLNNLGCPLNNHGNFTITSRTVANGVIEESKKAFAVSAYPNPSRTHFSVQIEGPVTEPVTIRVTDISGRLIEQRTKQVVNQVITIGATYKPGLYYIEVWQGTNKKQLKMVKQ